MECSNRTTSKPYAFELMLGQPYALDRLDLEFRWGHYGIRMLRFHHTSFPAGRSVSFHKHSDYEFHYIPRGKGKVILGEVPYALQEGMLYLTGPNVLHYQEADAVEAMDELCLHIDIVKLDEETDAAEGSANSKDWGRKWEIAEAEACIQQIQSLPARPAADQFRAMDCFLTAYRAWYENQPGLFTVLKQSIIQILLRTARTYASVPQPDLPSRDMKHYRYQLAVQFINDNYMEPLTLDIVAERVQISSRQLQRIFREHTGSTFSEYIEQLRLTHICSELSLSTETIDQIAFRNGFSSSNYLHYVFKKKFGITPMQYRQQHQVAATLS
ncbi:AraC-like DNA-binding protein/mannose-6-phosphate isomerase-like protein (cupin superfamily) [Paenibacillus sp. OAS669]|nr:AraC family transcriptional regulator [Paenibacillus sp. OAS669]MBE1441544.1 AraC-like DNA-binding protein/mannose-6-phosphate isomerase-like protein (cupin superfamily) [Paenibacillus sp. OAS669]